MSELDDDLLDLESAEDFLDYFELDYDPSVVRVFRLHILQRFHDYLKAAALPGDEEERFAAHAHLLERAYRDFVDSSAQEQKALRIFQKASGTAFVDATAIGRGVQP